MTINIWDNNPGPVSGSTPFGFYDTDSQFQADAPRVARFCANRLGYPLVDIELQSGSFYTCFEEAITTYGNEIYQYKIRENYFNLEGASTGSNLNNSLIVPSLASVIRISETYGSEAGVGGNIDWYTGSINLVAGQQVYDLNAWASSSLNLAAGDSIEIKRIFYESPPAIVRFFDPYAGTGTGVQSLLEAFGFGSFSPGINFMLMPIYFDLQKIQSIEFNDQIRKSGYSFELINNKLRIFPIPTADAILHFQFIKKSERINPTGGNNSNGVITNPGNVPYINPIYSQINSIGKQWIYAYTLALSKEVLGYIRGKYTSIPIPNSETTLNQSDLIAAATQEKQALIEQLRANLEETSRKTQLEKKASEAESANSILNNVPLPIYIG